MLKRIKSNLVQFLPVNFLPGKLTLSRGSARDYRALSAFHYLAPKPATFTQIWTVRYHDPHRHDSRPVAVGVLSYPMLSCTARERFLNLTHLDRREKLSFTNQNVRTISRIIVHPQFRALGLSTVLVRCLCAHCPTRYVEAIAAMGRMHPFFERAGMKRIEPRDRSKPVYFIFDREEKQS